jgi:hypothetical protein
MSSEGVVAFQAEEYGARLLVPQARSRVDSGAVGNLFYTCMVFRGLIAVEVGMDMRECEICT